MNTKAKRAIQALDKQRHKRQILTQQAIRCLWWLDKRIAPSYGGDAA